MLNATDKEILEQVADLHGTPKGAYNIRKNGEGAGRHTTANIDIITKTDKPGIDVIVKPGTKNESVHIPVIVSEEGLEDMVYNTFEIGADADVLIVAGCGIHNSGDRKSEHNGIHEFRVGKNARMKYVEKHYAQGEGLGEKNLNPTTLIEVEEGGVVELEMMQIKGVDYSKRDTKIVLHKNAKVVVVERLLTYLKQEAISIIDIELAGEDSTAQILSRSVAQNDSRQSFELNMTGKEKCRGHIQCDSIIMHKAQVKSIPQVTAYHSDAQLIHEAAIGKIAADQIVKLLSLGLTEEEAEEKILYGFLR